VPTPNPFQPFLPPDEGLGGPVQGPTGGNPLFPPPKLPGDETMQVNPNRVNRRFDYGRMLADAKAGRLGAGAVGSAADWYGRAAHKANVAGGFGDLYTGGSGTLGAYLLQDRIREMMESGEYTANELGLNDESGMSEKAMESLKDWYASPEIQNEIERISVFSTEDQWDGFRDGRYEVNGRGWDADQLASNLDNSGDAYFQAAKKRQNEKRIADEAQRDWFNAFDPSAAGATDTDKKKYNDWRAWATGTSAISPWGDTPPQQPPRFQAPGARWGDGQQTTSQSQTPWWKMLTPEQVGTSVGDHFKNNPIQLAPYPQLPAWTQNPQVARRNPTRPATPGNQFQVGTSGAPAQTGIPGKPWG